MVESFQEFPDYIGLRHDTEVIGQLDLKHNGNGLLSDLRRARSVYLQGDKVQPIRNEARTQPYADILVPV